MPLLISKIEPPPSRHPRIGDGSAVTRERILDFFAGLPDFQAPDPQRLPFVRPVDMGADETTGVARFPAVEGDFYPALVSAIDADGNEVQLTLSNLGRFRASPDRQVRAEAMAAFVTRRSAEGGAPPES